MLKFLFTRRHLLAAAVQLRHCSSSNKGTTPSSTSTAPLPQRNAPKETAEARHSGPLASRSSTDQAHMDSAFATQEDVADRLAAGRSPHLNPAYQSKWQRTGGFHDGTHQRQRQRQRQKSSTQRTTYAEEANTSARPSSSDNAHSAASADVPMVHPGADLPPLRQGRLTEKRVGKFSFVSDPSERASRDFYGHEVPNNTPKPKLPMWASSLTSPALGKVRLVEETWISQDARGTIDADTTAKFVRWLTDTVLPAHSLLREQLQTNVELDLRKATARGVYAKRAFRKGEVVLTIPVSTATPFDAAADAVQEAPNALGLTLNSEMLAVHSTSARRRPGLPSYDEVKRVLSVRRSSFDPIPHPVFLDQVHAALLLACEKADGPSSALYPYIQLLQGEQLFDDERIKELHLGVLDPQTHMEYTEHRNRFQHYLRELHKAWWNAYEAIVGAQEGVETIPGRVSTGGSSNASSDSLFVAAAKTETLYNSESDPVSAVTASGVQSSQAHSNTEAATRTDSADNASLESLLPPPSMEDLEWALRVVLSRQKQLSKLRVHQSTFAHIHEENAEGEVLDGFGTAVMKGKYAFYQHVLRAVDADRLRVNEVDPSAIPTVVPLLDMLNHPPGGVGNVTYSVEEEPVKVSTDVSHSANTAEKASPPTTASSSDKEKATENRRAYQVVVRAAIDIDEDDELTVPYTKCYSVAYTLYRYGFLPLGRREDDAAAVLSANGMGGTFQKADSNASAPKRWWSTLLHR